MPSVSEHGVLPLTPIERPRGLFVRFLYWATKRRFGITPTAFRVMYARSPFVGFLSLLIALGLELFVRIDRPLRFLLHVAISTQNGCTFCRDLFLAEAARAKLGRERFVELATFEDSSHYSEREKAALRYADALQRSLHIPDGIWNGLRMYFSERECADIVWVCAVERYYNSIALPLRIGSDRLAADRDVAPP